MRNTVPLRWIEDAEARRVLITALSERASDDRSWCGTAQQAVVSWLPRIGRVGPLSLGATQQAIEQQARFVRRPARHMRHSRDDAYYFGEC